MFLLLEKKCVSVFLMLRFHRRFSSLKQNFGVFIIAPIKRALVIEKFASCSLSAPTLLFTIGISPDFKRFLLCWGYGELSVFHRLFQNRTPSHSFIVSFRVIATCQSSLFTFFVILSSLRKIESDNSMWLRIIWCQSLLGSHQY